MQKFNDNYSKQAKDNKRKMASKFIDTNNNKKGVFGDEKRPAERKEGGRIQRLFLFVTLFVWSL